MALNPINATIHWQNVNDSSKSVVIPGSPYGSVTYSGISGNMKLNYPSVSVIPTPLSAYVPLSLGSSGTQLLAQGVGKTPDGTFNATASDAGVNTFWLFIGLQGSAAENNNLQFSVYFLQNFNNSDDVSWKSLAPPGANNYGWVITFATKTMTFSYRGTSAPQYLPWIEMTTLGNPANSGMAVSANAGTLGGKNVIPQAIFGWTGTPPASPVVPYLPPASGSPASKPPASKPPASKPPASKPPASSPSSGASSGFPVWAIVVLVICGVALIVGLGVGLGVPARQRALKPESK